MSIRFTKYVDITSVVGGAAQVPLRLWCARVFTTNELVGPNAILQFPSSADVLAFFGEGEEYDRAVLYFDYLSPLGVQPPVIQFARWVEADQPFTVYGESGKAVLATLVAITAGLLSFQFGATRVNLTGVTFAAATSLTDVASELQTKLRANAAVELSTCTVVWNSAAQAFDIAGSPTGVLTETANVVIPAGVVDGTDVAKAMGLYSSQGAIINSASLAESRVVGFQRVQSTNNNFGSFCYTTASDLTLSDAEAVAAANASINVSFIFRVNVDETTWQAWSTALKGFAGTGLEYELSDVAQGIEMLPMAVQAATNFLALNGTVGYMYRQLSEITPSVTDDTLSDSLDAARVNYYGATQTAGQQISFYQRGVLMGGATAPVDSTVYANEQWFKDLAGATLMSLQLALSQIPANKRGQGICDTALAAVITAALRNGTIAANSVLDIIQQAFITSQTGSSSAWQQVQNIGYWFASQITSAIAPSGITEYTYSYTIIYRKDDVIKTIVGSHQLI